jgi:hypothetical protein
MSSLNGGGPTPAKRIRELMTTVVILPERTAVADETVGVRIRIISVAERNEIYGGIPTFRMISDELLEYLRALDGRGMAEYQRMSDEADASLLRRAVIVPAIAPDEGGDLETTIPIEAVWPDRVVLIREILMFSGLMPRPPAPPAPGPERTSAAAEEIPEEAFRAPVEAPARDGGLLAPPGVGAPHESAS